MLTRRNVFLIAALVTIFLLVAWASKAVTTVVPQVTVLLPSATPSPSFSPEASPPLPPAPTLPATLDLPVRLNMKSYGKHSPEYDARILNIHPEYVIDNPPHGLWGEISGYDTDELLQNVAVYQAAGIKVIGYLTGGYEGTGSAGDVDPQWYSLEMNKKLITNMARLDHVDGIFVDECSKFPDESAKSYLRELTTHAKSYGLITWGNVGEDSFDPWFFTEGGFDFMHSTEDWHGQDLSPVQKEWGHCISVTGFNPDYTVQDALDLTIDAWNKGIAFCYINNAEYSTIAPWFEEYATLLKSYGKLIPARPQP
ncbi:MAG: hypothetical protein ABIB93_08075 [Chloroflexota bacterium]